MQGPAPETVPASWHSAVWWSSATKAHVNSTACQLSHDISAEKLFCTRAPLAALQRRYLRQPDALRLKLNAFQTVVSNPSWHIACTAGTRQQPNN